MVRCCLGQDIVWASHTLGNIAIHDSSVDPWQNHESRGFSTISTPAELRDSAHRRKFNIKHNKMMLIRGCLGHDIVWVSHTLGKIAIHDSSVDPWQNHENRGFSTISTPAELRDSAHRRKFDTEHSNMLLVRGWLRQDIVLISHTLGKIITHDSCVESWQNHGNRGFSTISTPAALRDSAHRRKFDTEHSNMLLRRGWLR